MSVNALVDSFAIYL